ncbi:MAG TPA: elongation factor Ts [Acholeplasmataceae bacterium]|jgi:elongation factor Ts|nr:elongation factor Ts [Acholeplasmataceae bacterium]
MISAQLVKELRDKTGAGMMDCKKALEATNGNFEEAITWLREKGIAKAEKKASRIAAEGVCAYKIEGNKAVVFELNSETDFVAKNENFQNLVSQIADVLINSNATNTEEALEVEVNGQKINDLIVNATATIGEKITLRRVSAYEKNDNEVFGAYSHMQGKIVSLAVLEGDNEEVAKDVCMHVAAMNPQYLREDQVDQDVIEKEKEILTQEALNEGKPEKIVEKIVSGRIKKYLKDICLEDQLFVKNQDQTVLQYVQANNSKIIDFIRLEVGEGIEKKCC